ncbi:MAG: hypothetical protein SV253_02820 [Halobacteria archaeon]|nr:hypothetical protein [Halobacteria archaeon]
MSRSRSSQKHLSSPVSSPDHERVTLEEAVETYKIWSNTSGAYLETDNTSLTHRGFEDLLGKVRESGIEISTVSLSRLVERFTSLESHILNDEEVRNLLRRYPNVVLGSGLEGDCGDTDWKHLGIGGIDNSVSLLLKSESHEESEHGCLLIVETAVGDDTDVETAVGKLAYEHGRISDIAPEREVHDCLVTLETDEYLESAADRLGVHVLELGPSSLIEYLESSAEWGNLRGLTLSP